MFRAQTQQRLRQPDFIVEIRFRPEHGETRAQHRRRQILRGRLAVGAGDGDDRQGKFRPPRMGDFLIRSQRIGHAEHRHRKSFRLLRAAAVGNQDARRACFLRFLQEILSVEPLAFQRDEQRAFFNRARVRRHIGKRDVAAARDGGSRRPENFLHRKARHQPKPPNASRATSRSSKCTFSVPMI